MHTVDDLLETATDNHRAGNLATARAQYEQVLAADPGHALALFRSGLLALQEGRPEPAHALLERACALRPDEVRFRFGLAQSLTTLGRRNEGAAEYRRILSFEPNHTDSHGQLGVLLLDAGDFRGARDALRSALALEPSSLAHAINLGVVLCQLRDFTAAYQILEPAAARSPDSAEAAFNLANALRGIGRPTDALREYHRAIALRPDYPDALNNLGNLLRDLGELAASKEAFERALALRPGYILALNNLGNLLRTLGRHDAAEDLLRRALDIAPEHAVLQDSLGNVLKDAGDLDQAIACFRESLRLEPGNAVTHSNLAYALCFQSPEAAPILEECRRWNQRFALPLPGVTPPPRNPEPGRRLKVGYVSPDFRDHCQSLFTLPLFEHHDHSLHEIFCYSSVGRPDAITTRIARTADIWRDVRTLDDAELAELIRADGIDVLVDLTMHMARGRPLAFARRPAPVQIAWLAYPGTTGIDAMEYRLSDPRLDPPESDDQYSETTLRLADTFWCYDPLTAEPPINALPSLARGYLTLGCLNNPCKFTPHTLRLWGEVMRALPDARLKLLMPEGRHRERLALRLAAQGIELPRVEYVGFRPRAEYLSTYNDIDFALDTFPYNGHTTSLDALWMGVPVVTRVGRTCVGRAGLSQLFNLGLTDLAADSDAAFVDIALALAKNTQRLIELRGALRAEIEHSPLMDGARFARNIEAAYRKAWVDYCAETPTPYS